MATFSPHRLPLHLYLTGRPAVSRPLRRPSEREVNLSYVQAPGATRGSSTATETLNRDFGIFGSLAQATRCSRKHGALCASRLAPQYEPPNAISSSYSTQCSKQRTRDVSQPAVLLTHLGSLIAPSISPLATTLRPPPSWLSDNQAVRPYVSIFNSHDVIPTHRAPSIPLLSPGLRPSHTCPRGR